QRDRLLGCPSRYREIVRIADNGADGIERNDAIAIQPELLFHGQNPSHRRVHARARVSSLLNSCYHGIDGGGYVRGHEEDVSARFDSAFACLAQSDAVDRAV